MAAQPSATPINKARVVSPSFAVETSAGERIDAAVVVNAAGLWSKAVGELAGVALPIVVGRHPVFVVERAAAFGPPHLVYLDLAGGSYARPESGGLTLTGSLTDDETQHPMEPDALGGDVSLDEATEVLARTGRAVVPVYDIAASARTGSALLEIRGAPVFIAEGIFAAEITRHCREAGVLADVLCQRGRPGTTFRRRLLRDLREGRKPPLFLVHRGWALMRAEAGIVQRQVGLGAHPCGKEEALRRIGAALERYDASAMAAR